MSKLTSIIDAKEDWHIERLIGISDDLKIAAYAYQQMGPEYTIDMPDVIEQTIERLLRLKGQIKDETTA